VGTNTDKIVEETEKLLEDEGQYLKMTKLHNPYGDGNASTRIVNFIKKL
jgi:UDP-N-acetylglucosamine 2-epimerase (non-hydrolysing)